MGVRLNRKGDITIKGRVQIGFSKYNLQIIITGNL